MFNYSGSNDNNDSTISRDFDSVVSSGVRKILVCHNLPDVIAAAKEARIDFSNVAGFVDLQWCLPYAQIKSLAEKPDWRDVVRPWMPKQTGIRMPVNARDLAERSLEAMRAMTHLKFPLNFEVTLLSCLVFFHVKSFFMSNDCIFELFNFDGQHAAFINAVQIVLNISSRYFATHELLV